MSTMLEDLDPAIWMEADLITETFVQGPILTGDDGEMYCVCHELIGGRWESFVSNLSGEGDER